jgi:hypothetical protein
MHRKLFLSLVPCAVIAMFLAPGEAQQPSAVSPVLTRSANNFRHGAYTSETVLTPQNVGGLHRIYSIPIRNDARGIESQPLVMPGVRLSDGSTHDLIVLSSMANDVIAADLKNGKILWQTNLGRPIDGNKSIDFWQINQHLGVLSTGVIDPDTFTWYGVTWTSPDGSPGKGWHSLHAVDLKAGKEVKAPLSMNPLTYNPGNGLPTARYAGQMRKQRSALSLTTVGGHKTIFVASGSILETNASASGWVAAADLQSWRFTGSWASTVRGFGAGIWQAGQGLAVDAKGDMYALTGNGSFAPPTDFGESFVHLRYTPPADVFHGMGKIEPVDWWSPYSDSGRIGQDPIQTVPKNLSPKLAGINAASRDGRVIEVVNADRSMHTRMMTPKNDPRYGAWGDEDLGSGGPVLVDKYGILGGGGKDGIWYSVRASNMGKTMPSDFAHPAANYAKLLSPPIWFTYAAFKHNAQGQVIGYEDSAPSDSTNLDFTYDGITHHLHSTPTLFESDRYGTTVECMGENGNARMFRVNPDGSLTFLANSQEYASPQSPGMTGGMLAVSSNGTKNGILWAIIPMKDANRSVVQGQLLAFDLTNLDKFGDGTGWLKCIYKSQTDFSHPKFNVPTISGGYVIVPTYSGRVDVFGLK